MTTSTIAGLGCSKRVRNRNQCADGDQARDSSAHDCFPHGHHLQARFVDVYTAADQVNVFPAHKTRALPSPRPRQNASVSIYLSSEIVPSRGGMIRASLVPDKE